MNPAPRLFSRFLGAFPGTLAFALATALATPALAGPGHEGGHDEDTAPLSAAGPAMPRTEAHSDLFELVAAMRGADLVLTLDRYASNEPVAGAQIELESGSYKAVAEYRPESASYRFAGTPFAAPGSYPLTLTVSAGDEVDLLAADLVVPDPASAANAADAPASTASRLPWGAAAVATTLAAAVVLALALRRRRAA